MEVMELRAEARTGSGKGPARRLRSQGKIPAVFYGGGADSVPISVSTDDLLKLLRSSEENIFVKLVIDESGQKAEKAVRDQGHSDRSGQPQTVSCRLLRSKHGPQDDL
jgi:large subunit ribosomal protein L25